MGAQLVKEVATKTNDVAGDGTTTATVFSTGNGPGRYEEPGGRRQPDRASPRYEEGN